MNDIGLIFDFLFDLFDGIGALYTTGFILSSVLALWVLRKVVNYFKYIAG